MDVKDLLMVDCNNLDALATIKPVVRTAYSSDSQVKPNGHCYWDADLGLWLDDDATFRARIIAMSAK